MSHRQVFPTRWNDNDVYGHINNTIHYAAMDTTINTWMIAEGGLDIEAGDVMAVCASSSCTYLASAAFPDAMVVDLSVARLGSTSITWQLAIFRERDGLQLATGQFVHVFVGRDSLRPVPIPERMRAAVESNLEVIA
ncbi:MAG: acyl-CoA thioesterase [Microbacteriaceae bacterium]|nr:acyl-CoA thioesterase [Microbacteriaceae bacterium]